MLDFQRSHSCVVPTPKRKEGPGVGPGLQKESVLWDARGVGDAEHESFGVRSRGPKSAYLKHANPAIAANVPGISAYLAGTYAVEGESLQKVSAGSCRDIPPPSMTAS